MGRRPGRGAAVGLRRVEDLTRIVSCGHRVLLVS
jgi:hypothetical protein